MKKPTPQDLWNQILTQPPYDLESRRTRYLAAMTEHSYPPPGGVSTAASRAGARADSAPDAR